MGFQLFQALLAVMQLWPLGPVLQVFFQRSLQRLGSELARFHEYGKDLVCAGVSAVATGICNTLAKKGFLEEKKCAIILKNGNIMIDVYENDEVMQVILETLVISLESFTEDYHQYIKITYEEE